MDLGHTVSNGRYSSNHCPVVSFCSVEGRTGGGAAGLGQVDAPAPQVPPKPLPGEKLLWAGQGAELASSAGQRTVKQKPQHDAKTAVQLAIQLTFQFKHRECIASVQVFLFTFSTL